MAARTFDEDARTAGAALLLAALLWLGSAPPRGAPLPAPCRSPAERAGDATGTRWVGCDTDRPRRPLRGVAPLLFGRPLDLSRASARDLEALPGIGPARARDIVARRAERPFAERADLRRVRGIGPATVERLEGWAEVGAEARHESQIAPQLLSNPCENSYKRRAVRAGGGVPDSPDRPDVKAGADCAEGGSVCLDPRIQGLQGGFPSCD